MTETYRKVESCSAEDLCLSLFLLFYELCTADVHVVRGFKQIALGIAGRAGADMPGLSTHNISYTFITVRLKGCKKVGH